MKVPRGSQVTSLLSFMNGDRKEESFCDVTLEVDGKKFPAHRCVLANVSLFFRKMFNTNMKEKYDKSLTIQGVDSDIMKIILDFVYGEEADVNDDDVMKLLEASDYLQMDELKFFCGMLIRPQIDQHNCLEFYNLGQTFTCESLCVNAVEIAADYIDEVVEDDEFKDLDRDTASAIIRSVENERSDDACKAVLVWVKHDVDKRKEYLSDLFKLIDFTQLSNEYMNETLDHDDLVNASHECKNLFLCEQLSRLKVERLMSEVSQPPDNESVFERNDGHRGLNQEDYGNLREDFPVDGSGPQFMGDLNPLPQDPFLFQLRPPRQQHHHPGRVPHHPPHHIPHFHHPPPYPHLHPPPPRSHFHPPHRFPPRHHFRRHPRPRHPSNHNERRHRPPFLANLFVPGSSSGDNIESDN